MGLTVPMYVFVMDLILALAIGYVLVFMVRRVNRYDSELNTLIKYSIVFLSIAELGRIMDLVDDFCCVEMFYYPEWGMYFVSIVGVVYTVVYYITLVEKKYIPGSLVAASSSERLKKGSGSRLGAHIVFSRNRLIDVIDLMKNYDFPVLAVTRSPHIYEGLGRGNVKTVWVTQVQGGIPPTSLHLLQDAVLRFLRENPSAVLVVDCLEYLLIYNDFKTVYKFLVNLKDYIMVNFGSGMVVFIDDSVISPQERSLLLKEFEPL